jgi:hypothetical protein
MTLPVDSLTPAEGRLTAAQALLRDNPALFHDYADTFLALAEADLPAVAKARANLRAGDVAETLAVIATLLPQAPSP